ncbi:DUF5946 family protein [Gracilibacillus alcaliphilus]|uniref:DUF5946 family protein n=1 Tax=Gracilibacillus alcaliphilus TaxID=1401441 RepID=UPI00195CA263|nr:DUF5946 family protein [Gracilibacillus alcaliphilus]MBM7679751.1 hypothetical protein [Gracilibacillus alcaliphilus]
MQNIERQAKKKGVKLDRYGRCQFCGSDTKGGVFECFEVFNSNAGNFANLSSQSQFIYADTHCLQHSEVHGTWNNNFHLTRQYLILEKYVNWDYSKTSQLTNTLDKYKLTHPEAVIPALSPLERGQFTITDLIGHKQNKCNMMLLQWANDVYQAYKKYHPIAKVVGDLFINKFEK